MTGLMKSPCPFLRWWPISAPQLRGDLLAEVTLMFRGLKPQVLEVLRKAGLYHHIGIECIYAIYEWLKVEGADGALCPLRPPQLLPTSA